jgi:hypothetical protein
MISLLQGMWCGLWVRTRPSPRLRSWFTSIGPMIGFLSRSSCPSCR